MGRIRCRQCRRMWALKHVEITISDGNTTYYHRPMICWRCALTLSGTLEVFEEYPTEQQLDLEAVQRDDLVRRS